ncbi:MAG: hypothetical protein DDT34_02543 [Firmicutes bacterium]|nr:hypothetical protein [Bacillota bacterium]MBT9166669.1 hypothetical protein [Chloroflexota bacterium]
MERSYQHSIGQCKECSPESVIKTLSPQLLSAVIRDADAEDDRERSLPAALTMVFVVLLGFFRRVSYVNLLEKFHHTRLTSRFWKGEKPPSSTALTKARDRLGLKPVALLFRRIVEDLEKRFHPLTFHGREVNAIDGSTFPVADTLSNRRHFGLPGVSRGRAGYPQLHVACLVQIGTRIVKDLVQGRYRAFELGLARKLFPKLGKGVLVLMDRLFFAFDFLWDLRGQGCDFVVRMKSNCSPRVVKRLSKSDAIVEIEIPRYYRKKRPDMPRTWTLRMISYVPEGGTETIRLLTTLLDPKIPRDEIAALYHERWEVETVLDEIKTHLADCTTVNRPVVFRSHTPMRVKQELYGMVTAYNILRGVMADVGNEFDIAPTRLSFTGTLERVRECMRDVMLDHSISAADRIRFMRCAIARGTVPKRPGRKSPRAVKVKMSGFPLKRNVA